MGEVVGLAASDSARAEKAEWMRKNLPVCTGFAAEVRKVFPEVRMLSASENGHCIGKAAA